MSDSPPDGGRDEPVGGVGGVGEEAAKLLHALQDWAEGSGSEHTAADGADCTYCPLCRLISAVSGTSPEVRQHLSTAAYSLMQAAAVALATTVPDRTATRRDASREKIDLDDDEWEDD